ALILSLIFTGLGQFYNGETSKGVVFLLVAILLWIITFLFFFTCVILIPFWIYGMYDAYTRAEHYNRSLRATGRPPWQKIAAVDCGHRESLYRVPHLRTRSPRCRRPKSPASTRRAPRSGGKPFVTSGPSPRRKSVPSGTRGR